MLSDAHQELIPALSGMTEIHLAHDVPEEFNRPPLAGSVGNALARLHFHESYHAGQIGAVTTNRGKKGRYGKAALRQSQRQPATALLAIRLQHLLGVLQRGFGELRAADHARDLVRAFLVSSGRTEVLVLPPASRFSMR